MAYVLEAKSRDEESPQSLRREGRIPGVVYGPEVHRLLSFDRKDLHKLLSRITRSSRVTLQVDGDELEVFIKEIQHHPWTDELLHVDFYRPPAGEPVTLEVPILLSGEAQGRKSGGILTQFREVVEVRGPIDAVPELVELDVTELDIHDALHASDLSLPAGIELLTPLDAMLAAVLAPRKIEEVVAAKTGEAAEGMAETAEEAAEGMAETAEEAAEGEEREERE